jgi:hypothetical protein
VGATPQQSPARHLLDFEHFVVPETKHLPTSSAQEIIAHNVRPTAMLTTVDFHNQARSDAGEIDRIRRNRMLSSETVPELGAAQTGPEISFSISRRCTKLPRLPRGRVAATHHAARR